MESNRTSFGWLMDCSNDSATLLPNLLHIAHQGVRHFGVQSTGGLVQQEQGWIPGCQGQLSRLSSPHGSLLNCAVVGIPWYTITTKNTAHNSGLPSKNTIKHTTSETKKSNPQQRQRHVGALPLTTRDATDEAWGTHHRVATFLQVQLLDDTWSHQNHRTSFGWLQLVPNILQPFPSIELC